MGTIRFRVFWLLLAGALAGTGAAAEPGPVRVTAAGADSATLVCAVAGWRLAPAAACERRKTGYSPTV